jgi:hypothetical protein
MAALTFEVDNATLAAIDSLKEMFGVKSNAEVIRKALALAKVAAENAEGNELTIVVPFGLEGNPSEGHHIKKIIISG